MAAIRLYLAALTLVFIIAVVATIGIGVLEATVMTSVPLLLILDIREELKEIKLLEERLAALTQ
jgi:hypothetical protein